MLQCPHCGSVELMGVQIPGVYDGVLYWECLEGGHLFNTWPEDHHRHQIAEAMILARKANASSPATPEQRPD